MHHAPADMIRAGARLGVAASAFAVLATLAAASLAEETGTAAPEVPFRVVIGGSNAPFEYRKPDGTPAGFSIDLSEAICTLFSRPCVYVCVAWEEAIPALLAGRGDAIISSM